LSATDLQVIYLIVSGAGAARIAPNLLKELSQFSLPVYTFLTKSAHRIINPDQLAGQPGHRLVESYFDPVLLNGRAPGLTLVVPATFNTLNKISQGIADTLPHSLVAEAIGAGWPVVIAPAMNRALANHPRTVQSLKTLQQWGVTLLELQPQGEELAMAPLEEIVSTVKTILSASIWRK
jgi:phosphopantothenoylcysteine synthetase/decarboxylase